MNEFSYVLPIAQNRDGRASYGRSHELSQSVHLYLSFPAYQWRSEYHGLDPVVCRVALSYLLDASLGGTIGVVGLQWCSFVDGALGNAVRRETAHADNLAYVQFPAGLKYVESPVYVHAEVIVGRLDAFGPSTLACRPCQRGQVNDGVWPKLVEGGLKVLLVRDIDNQSLRCPRNV